MTLCFFFFWCFRSFLQPPLDGPGHANPDQFSSASRASTSRMLSAMASTFSFKLALTLASDSAAPWSSRVSASCPPSSRCRRWLCVVGEEQVECQPSRLGQHIHPSIIASSLLAPT